ATAGANTLTAAAAGLAGSPVTFQAQGTAGPAATLAKFSGDNQVGQVGTALATPHTVLVTDAHGNPVPNVTVTWAAASGGGSVNPTSSATDAAGHASTTRTLGPTPGTQTTTASAAGLTPVTFSVTAQVGGATQMAISGGQGQTDTVGQTLPVPLSVRVADALNNPVAGVTISWSVVDGGGSVNPLTSSTNSSGIASTNWTLGTAMTPTDSTQTAQATGVGSALSFTGFTVPGAVDASQTTVVAAPAAISAPTGRSASPITVTARDHVGQRRHARLPGPAERGGRGGAHHAGDAGRGARPVRQPRHRCDCGDHARHRNESWWRRAHGHAPECGERRGDLRRRERRQGGVGLHARGELGRPRLGYEQSVQCDGGRRRVDRAECRQQPDGHGRDGRRDAARGDRTRPVQQSRGGCVGDVHSGGRERQRESHDTDRDERDRCCGVDLLDAGHHRWAELSDRDLGRPYGQPGHVRGPRDGGRGDAARPQRG